MAKRFAAVRTRQSLKPCDDEGRQILQGLSPGEPVLVTVTQPRNLRQHRLFFALLGKVMENLPLDQRARFPNKDRLLDAIKIGTGRTEYRTGLDGATYVVPQSIAFDAMDQSEFGEFFRQAIDVIREYVIEDLDADALLEEVNDMIGA